LKVGIPSPKAARSTGPTAFLVAADGFLRPDLATEVLLTLATYGWFCRPARLFVLTLIALWLDLWLANPGLYSLEPGVPPKLLFDGSTTDPKKPFFAGVSLEY